MEEITLEDKKNEELEKTGVIGCTGWIGGGKLRIIDTIVKCTLY